MPFQKPDYRQSSVNPGNHRFWFGTGEHEGGSEFATTGVTCHTLYAVGFYTGQGGLVQNVGIRTRASGSFSATNVRVALYGTQFEASADLYPQILILDCGSFPAIVANSTYTNATSFVLPADSFLWATVIANGNVAMAGFDADKHSIFGTPMTSNFGNTYSFLTLAAASYEQAWPIQFPSSAVPNAGTVASAPLVAFQITVT